MRTKEKTMCVYDCSICGKDYYDELYPSPPFDELVCYECRKNTKIGNRLGETINMNSLEEAMELKKRSKASLDALQWHDSFKSNCKESEVILRFRALYGILIMACNDIDELVKYWKDQS